VLSNASVYSYHRLSVPNFQGRQNNGADFRLRLIESDSGPTMAVHSVTVQDTAFSGYGDAEFQLYLAALDQPWNSTYTGSSRDDVDTTSLKDKVLAGYQCWFNTPNDFRDEGWLHWAKSRVMKSANFNTDMWPDLTDYLSTSKVNAANVLTASGAQAKVFSSADIDAVETHFKWMRQHNIDGVFLQRFLKSSNLATSGYSQWDVANVREAAHLQGRIWAIEYDVSSISEANMLAYVQGDWNWLTSTTGFNLLSDSRYAHENGKPVVAIYGLGNKNNPDPATPLLNGTALALINWFKNTKGCYVWGGVPNDWLTEWNDPPDSSNHTKAEVYQAFNAIEAWHSTNITGDLNKIASVQGWNAEYWPIIWPGFSWSNEQYPKSGAGAFKDRLQGDFYWGKIYGAINGSPGVARPLFVGMFDEYDEGTAIMKMADDHPNATNPGCSFIDNQTMPSDWWLLLTAEAKAMMLGQRPLSSTKPLLSSLSNRSNIGAQAFVNLDSAANNDDEQKLFRVDVAYDGKTLGESLGGKPCRANDLSQGAHSLYFNVDDTFIYQSTGADVTIIVEYYDATGSVPFQLEYDAVGTGNNYKVHPKGTITTTGTGRWRTVRYEIADAYFGNRENPGPMPNGTTTGTDFRIHVTSPTAKLDLNRVWVIKP
jgi:hypothetical protein